MITTNTKRPQGFAVLSPEHRSRIASMGGKASWAQGRAHRWTSEEAQEAGRKGGGKAKRRNRRGFREEL